MTFLSPAILLALPLVTLPVIIHLVNQRRFQSVEWAAMRFLLAAKALSRGYSRLRQWLILFLRMLAVAAAVMAVARPLSRGWLSAVGGERSAAVVLVDRSPSMSEAPRAGGESKLAAARTLVASALETLGTGRVVLVDSVSCTALELGSPRDLLEVAEATPAAAPADMPRMLQAACAQIEADTAAAGSIWILSDQRAADWKPASGAWSAIRTRLADNRRPVRVNLLADTAPAPDDIAVRVTRASWEATGTGQELFLDIALRRQGDTGPVRVPVAIELGGVRSTVEVEVTGTTGSVSRHAIAVDPAALGGNGAGDRAVGFGRVSIPADANPADNEFHFTFGVSPVRRTLVVAEDAEARRVLELAAGLAPDRLLRAAVTGLEPDQASAAALDDVALVVWQAPLPEGAAADRLTAFVADGGQVIFLPPSVPTNATFAGLGWGGWSDHSPPLVPAGWRADEGLLAATDSGTNLPVGEVEVRRVCRLTGEATPLATLADDVPLLVRAATDRGGAWFLATTPAPRDSDLAAGGVVLYALLQRAIDAGLVRLSAARQDDAAPLPERSRNDRDDATRQVAGSAAPSSETGAHAGVFETRGRLLAVNRPAAEDDASIVADAEIERLFAGVPFARIEQRSGAGGNLVEEVWRTFLVALLLALAAEGLLSLPPRPRLATVAGEATP